MTHDVETELPLDLLEPPFGDPPPPPVETAHPVLPTGELTPTNFERLCLRLASLEGSPYRSRRYGVPGQKQYGIDIYSRLPSGRYATYQCKRYERVVTSDLKDSVDEFLKGRWAARSERFVFCTSGSADWTQLEEEIERQTSRLAACTPPIAFDVWDAESISERLRRHQEIVLSFFGPHWTRRFFGQAEVPGTTTAEIESAVKAGLAKGIEPTFVTNDWAPAPLRPRLDDVRARDPALFGRLTAQFGSPPQPLLVVAATQTPPPWLEQADDASWELVARIAQALGEWPAAARAWERTGQLRAGPLAASAYVQAATAVNADNNTDERDRLMKLAAAADEHNARLVLACLDVNLPPKEQLERLDALTSEDPEELGLIAARRAVACLLLTDTDAARHALADVRRHLPGSALIEGLEVSITVQEGRLAILAHRSLDRGALRSAADEAKTVGDRLRDEHRYSESTRLVMLEADSHALLGERTRAASIIRQALAEERSSQEQKEVLADCAAGRALDFRLALDLLADADETPTALRIRLECLENVGSPPERDRALRELDRLVAEGGDQAPEAALHRLAATLGAKPTPWSDDAAVYLRSTGFERVAVTAEALYLVVREGWAPVARLLRPFGKTPWALAAGLRASLHQRVDPKVALAAAREVLSIGPSHPLRVDAAQGLRRGGDLEGARQTAVAVARDPNAPEAVRGDAFDLAIRIVGADLNDWVAAGELHDEWVKLVPADTRAQSWAPMIANRRRG